LAAQYRVPPQGPDEQAVAQAFDALVRAYGRQDWDDVMALIADDAQIEARIVQWRASAAWVSANTASPIASGSR
jgi:HD-like signal output (HDOD) protein